MVIRLGDGTILAAPLLAEIYRRELKPSLITVSAERRTGCRGGSVPVAGSLRKGGAPGGGRARDAALAWDSHQGTAIG